MAAYCAKADLVERFGKLELEQLTDESAAAAADDTEISNACDEATSLIDGYVISRYTTPLSPVPTVVRRFACDIARKILWKDRAGKDSIVQANYDAALAWLKDLARGIVQLPGATGTLPTGSAGGFAYATPENVFDTAGLL